MWYRISPGIQTEFPKYSIKRHKNGAVLLGNESEYNSTKFN